MKAVIHSHTPLDAKEMRRVKDILKESLCPNESLRATFPRYSHIEGHNIYFDSGDRRVMTGIDY